MRYYIVSILVILTMVILYLIHRAPIYVPPYSVKRDATVTEWKKAVEENEKIKARAEQQKQNRAMDTSLVMLIVSTAGILAVQLFNAKNLEKKIIENREIDKAEHAVINQELKVLKTPEKLELKLREMAAGKVGSCHPDLRQFINEEAELLISVSNEIMHGSFNFAALTHSMTKIEQAEKNSILRAESFGIDFVKKYQTHCQIVATKLKDDISDIVLDEIFNSKHSRFSLSCQVFLRDHLTGIINIYNELH